MHKKQKNNHQADQTRTGNSRERSNIMSASTTSGHQKFTAMSFATEFAGGLNRSTQHFNL
jgi:hypothetical protein